MKKTFETLEQEIKRAVTDSFLVEHGHHLVRHALRHLDKAHAGSWVKTQKILCRNQNRSRSHQLAYEMWAVYLNLIEDEAKKEGLL